jgi:hypothetical protein
MAYARTGNKFYSQGREGFLKGEIDWVNDDICIGLFNVYNDTGSTGGYDDASQRFYSDIESKLIEFKVAETDTTFTKFVSLTGKTATDGIADADDVTLYEVQPISDTDDAGKAFEAIVLFKWIGDPSMSPLICFIDTGTGLPFIPNSGHIKVNFSNGPNKIFKL